MSLCPFRIVPALSICLACVASAENPLIMDQFTADPTARVFKGKMYVYPSHDIRGKEGQGRPDWFCMEDYHVFSSENLTDWTDHGVIVTQNKVDWVRPDSYSMWAPDCVEKDGKYYFYFPSNPKSGGGFTVGVAVADQPEGPFTPRSEPIAGISGIDPCVLIDKDGQAYIYYSQGRIFVAKLKPNMVELDSQPQAIANLPTRGLIEGPFTFERNGVYYLTYPHAANNRERIEYAMGMSPMGPFEPAGVIMDESPSECWTIHQSIVEYNGQWYFFYHDRDLSPSFDKNRAIRAEKLTFNDDGTIQKVERTLRGVGIVDARSGVDVDRYSEASPEGVEISFVNESSPFEGWKASFADHGAWVRVGDVDFGDGGLSSAEARATADGDSAIEIRVDGIDGPLLATVNLTAGDGWATPKAKLANAPTGVHDVVVRRSGQAPVSVDWVRFE